MNLPPPPTSAGSPSNPVIASLNRRQFLARAATGAGTAALWSALGSRGWAATSAMAADAPESPDVNFGIIALTDCSPIVIAHEKGLFKKYGINSKVTKGANWAAIRDNLSSGSIQATHMLLGMPFASTMGLLGAPKKPMVIPWLLNRNGQAISLKTEWKGQVAGDPKALKPFAAQAKKNGEPLTFAMTFPLGTHAMWLRYYLAAGGIHPGGPNGEGGDISLIVVPPAQMISNMKIGKMDGFCVGEPWGARAISDGTGYTSVTTQDIWKDHPEKVCAFTEEFALRNPKTVKAVLKALHEASVWLDDFKHRPEQCEIISKPTYLNCDPKTILGRLMGELDYGDGRKVADACPMHFSRRGCNFPQPKYGRWFLSQYRRWGMIAGAPDYDGVVKRVMRGDLYAEAMREMGVAVPEVDLAPETLFDGVTFDPKDPEAYAKGFAVKNLRG
jgi:nitrate/nitrite transport system substrate-binding protein